MQHSTVTGEPVIQDFARSAEQLVELITAGDRPAFDELYRRQLPLVRTITCGLIRDFHQAEEVAQEVMLEVWQQAPRFDPCRGSAGAWISRIARTRAIDRIRSSQAARVRDQRQVDHSHAEGFDSVSETAMLQVEISQVHRGLLAVSALQREALVLAFFTDQSYPDIANLLHIPLGTLKTRIRSGLLRMRKVIDELNTDIPAAA